MRFWIHKDNKYKWKDKKVIPNSRNSYFGSKYQSCATEQ